MFQLSDKRDIHEIFASISVALLDKAKAAEVASHWYQVGAACRLLGCDKLDELAEVIL